MPWVFVAVARAVVLDRIHESWCHMHMFCCITIVFKDMCCAWMSLFRILRLCFVAAVLVPCWLWWSCCRRCCLCDRGCCVLLTPLCRFMVGLLFSWSVRVGLCLFSHPLFLCFFYMLWLQGVSCAVGACCCCSCSCAGPNQ